MSSREREKNLLSTFCTAARSTFLMLPLLTAVVFCSLPVRAEDGKKTILYLNSYHNGYQWSDGLLEGVRSVFNSSRYKVDLQIEYMDAKKFDYRTISTELHSLYRQKFSGEQFDIIIISDNDALNFINQYRDELFPGVPVVFCGVNDLKDSDISAGNITGVVELFDFTATMEVARTLHPERDQLFILLDDSTAGRAIRNQVEKIVGENDLGLDIEFWTQLSLAEAQNRVRRLPDNAFLFIAPYYQTIKGRFYTSEEVSEAIYRHSSVPIYTAWEFMVGYGAVGGKVLSGIEHGKIAGNMAIRILAGERADEIAVINRPQGVFLFDYAVMNKLGINQMLLPPNRSMINTPKASYALSKELFWTIMISFILLLLALVSMLGAMFERRKVELKIIDQLAFQQTLMDTIPQLVSWKDVSGRYLGANQAFTDFFGIPQTQLVEGKVTTDIVGDNDYGNWSAQLDERVIREKKAFRKQKRRVTDQDGGEAWLEVNKVPLEGQGGRLVGVLSTAENITKEQSLEQQLLQSQKMEAIGTLAGGISHDFNNILTSIINSTELAIGDLIPGSQTEKDLERVLKAARRGSRVVQQILSFSRPSTENFRPTDLAAVVQEVAQLMEASTPANIGVVCNIDSERNYIVNADPTQIHQAILNLTTNAYHALRETGGTMIIRLGHSSAASHRQVDQTAGAADRVIVSVADDGPGIAGEIIGKIFDPFFSTKSKAEGTGLGLAVVHGIVQSHQGFVRVFPAEGGGVVFEIDLPSCPDGEQPIVGQSTEEELSEGRILFVEDDEDQLQTTPRLLEELGFTVIAVSNPEKALERVSSGKEHFDLIISDFDMPGLSGVELAARLPELPVILVSGREGARAAAARSPNIRRVVIKPYQRKELVESIRELVIGGGYHG